MFAETACRERTESLQIPAISRARLVPGILQISYGALALCRGQLRFAVLKKRATAQKLQQMLEPEWCEQILKDSARWRATALAHA